MKTIRLLTILALITSAACSADSNEPQQTYPTYETPDSGRPDLGVEDQGGNTPTEDMGLPLADMGEAEQDMPRVEPDMDMMRVDLGTPGPDDKTIRGRFESAGPVQTCGSVVSWTSPDGFLLRPRMNVCGDDANALGDTILANLNAAAEKGSRVMLVISQGIELPASWLDECESFAIESGRFTGKTCAPWDSKYQGLLREALQLHTCSTKSFGCTFILREQSGHTIETGSSSLCADGLQPPAVTWTMHRHGMGMVRVT